MTLRKLLVLLPCYSLEDLELERDADEAEQLLSAWCALWHPALVAAAKAAPAWASAEQAPYDAAGHLITIPQCAESRLPADWLERAEAAGAKVLRGIRQRDELVAAALSALEGDPPQVDGDLAADFLALGFGHLTVELLTRQLRYMSNLDEVGFQSKLVAAAEGAAAGDEESARQNLQAAFNLLHESREYFYPVEAHLLDLTVVAPTTIGQPLRRELNGRLARNLLITGQTVEEMARREPATLEALKAALGAGRAGLVGGEFGEPELPLLCPEAIADELRRGLRAYERHLGTRPVVFGRRRYGLTPALPQVLRRFGFTGALHATLDDGRFPAGNQSRIQWEGLDGTSIEAIGRVPFDVSRADAFLRLPERLGNSMDLDHVATVVLAHWPGQSSPWYDDLRRIAGYTSALGAMTTVDDYFDQTAMSGQRADYGPDRYRSPYLKQAVAAGQADPISRWVRFYSRRARRQAARTLDTLATLLGATAGLSSSADPASTDEPSNPEDPGDAVVQAELEAAVSRLASALTGQRTDARRGYLVFNPLSFSRRLCIETPRLAAPPDVAGPIRAVAAQADAPAALVEVPAMGLAWVGPGSGKAADEPAAGARRRWLPAKPRKEPPMGEENVLRNEFCEVVIDPATGAIRGIGDYGSRGPRLAQQIALRLPDPQAGDSEDDRHYSIMAADEVRLTSAGPLLGEIVVRGRLVDRHARRLAGFRQTTRVRRGSRVVEILVELDPERLPERNPWASYYAARFAWSDAALDTYRSVGLAACPTDAVQIEAPHFIELRAEKRRTTLLTGGLPYHGRFGLRKLDTLLVVHGETARSFRLGVGIDLPQPAPAALEMLAPETIAADVPSPPAPAGWLFHVDAANVVATSWAPWVEDGRPVGFRVRLLETAGQKGRVGLRCLRPVASAACVAAEGKPSDQLPVDGDRIDVVMRRYGWVEVEVRLAL